MSAVLTPTTRSVLARLFEPIERAYVEFRLRNAESDLEAFEREAKNRADQMKAHRHYCEELRVRLAVLTNR